jgi:hypothetical protein
MVMVEVVLEGIEMEFGPMWSHGLEWSEERATYTDMPYLSRLMHLIKFFLH